MQNKQPDPPPRDPATSPLDHVRGRIAHAARIASRKPGDIALIAISKTHGQPAIEPLLREGHRLFGENRVQEARDKWPAIKAAWPDAALHMVGRLQSNKAEDAVALFDAIHSLDRRSLVAALGKAMTNTGRRVPCFIQVNVGNEPQKGGCALADLPDLLDAAQQHDVPVTGLMCVPPLGVEAAPYFALLAETGRRNGLGGLSMGMSDDYETAIMLGATYVRVGSALFGRRS